LTTGFGGATAAGLRFQEGRNVPELVSDGRSVDSPERAAHVQSSFVLQHLHAAPADGGVYVLVDPRPWDRRHLRQIDRPGNAAHIVTAMPVSRWEPSGTRIVAAVITATPYEAMRWQARRFALGNVGPLWVGGSPHVCLRPLIRADSGVHLSVSEMQDQSELPEIGELRPRPRSLLKEAPLSIWGTGHHEMPFDAILGQYLDKGIPL
jgi:hypothetical protein